MPALLFIMRGKKECFSKAGGGKLFRFLINLSTPVYAMLTSLTVVCLFSKL